MPRKRLVKYGLVGVGIFALVASYNVGWTIAQSAHESADGGKPVSTPEPTKIPVKDAIRKDNGGGIDPELGTIQEPDLSDVQPALRTDGSGDWKTPDQIARDKAKSQAQKDAEAILAAEKSNDATNSAELPKLSTPKIPIIPINLLFPQSQTNVGVKKEFEDEIRGSSALFYGVNRETGQALKFRIAAGRAVNFNQLTIVMKGCFRSNANESPESWAYVDIIDNGEAPKPQLAVIASRNRVKAHQNNSPKLLKHGWIIASSPDVTPIDHPNLNVTLMRCEGGIGQQTAAIEAPKAASSNKTAKTNKPKALPAKKPVEKSQAESEVNSALEVD